MKICFFNVTASFLTGGLETYCWEAGHALTKLGHDVTIMAGDIGKNRNKNIRLLQYPFKREETWPNWGSRFRRLLERRSFAKHALSDLISEQYDAVIINKPFDFPALWQAKRRGMKSCCIYRSGGQEFFPTDRWFVSAIDHWVSTSRYNANQVEKHYKIPVQVINNGVDIELFSPNAKPSGLRNKLNLGNDVPIIVSVGRLVGWKGHKLIIESIKSNNAHYVLIGDGDAKEALQKQAQSLNITQRVHFLGKVKHCSLPNLLVECDIFVQPSIGEEAFGISIVEAMASGLPVLASNNGGISEIVIPGDTGELINNADQQAWNKALEHLINNTQLREKYAHLGRKRAIDTFTWAANAKKLENLIKGNKTK